ncbi:MAG: hypothetical protein HYY04_10935, partial [Chloroflexi bacterium]|nr:hypothetical protein [Chloroflexota bacterium]
AEQIVAQVRARGGVVEYRRFEDEGHGIVKLPNRIRAYTAIADFLDCHVLNRPGLDVPHSADPAGSADLAGASE